jgi:P2-related tail formation protein
MKDTSSVLSATFRVQGFQSFEIRELVKDVFSIVRHEERGSLGAMNRELEDLGWGIDVMDRETFNTL